MRLILNNNFTAVATTQNDSKEKQVDAKSKIFRPLVFLVFVKVYPTCYACQRKKVRSNAPVFRLKGVLLFCLVPVNPNS